VTHLFSLAVPRHVRITELWRPTEVKAREAAVNPVADDIRLVARASKPVVLPRFETLATIRAMRNANGTR
jgi:hypothetical protein